MSLRFVSYARKSSQGDSKQVESIQDQEKSLQELADCEGLFVLKELSEARSAKEPHTRPVYRAVIDMVKKGEANAILCWHLNRLSRNALESGELQWLLQSGKLLCIKTPEREYHPEDHALLMAVESSMAAQYVRDLKRDVARGVEEKVKRGWYPFKAKAGYLVDPVSKELLPDPVRFPLLKQAWELMLSRTYSVPQVLEALNSWGYRGARTKSGGEKPMTRSGLYRLFNDPFYAGVFTFQGAEHLSCHEPMVSLAEFKAVQRLLKGKTATKGEERFHAYAGLIVCGTCGCRITAETHVKNSGKTYTYYHCTGRRGCPRISISEDDLESQLLAELTDCKLDPEFVDWALQTLARDTRERTDRQTILAGTTSASAAIVRKKIDRLFTMRENEEISREEFLERKARYTQELTDLKKDALAKADKAERDRQTLEKVLTFTRDWYGNYTSGNPWAKRQVAVEFAISYVLTQGKLTPTCHPAIDRIRTFERTKSPAQQIGPSSGGSQNLVWRAMLDELRTLVAETGEGVSGLPNTSFPDANGASIRSHLNHRLGTVVQRRSRAGDQDERDGRVVS